MAYATDLEQRIGIDVQDPVAARALALRGEVALRFAADTYEPEELDDRVVFRPVENLADQLPVIGHSIESQDPGKHLVAVAEAEFVRRQLEQRDPDWQRLQDTGQQLVRLA